MTSKFRSLLSRRQWLGATMGLGAFTLHLAGCSKSAPQPLCGNPDELTNEQLSLRSALNYVERAIDQETCSQCAFFKMKSIGTCGDCQLLKGPVNPQGHCNSWSRGNAVKK